MNPNEKEELIEMILKKVNELISNDKDRDPIIEELREYSMRLNTLNYSKEVTHD
jgi:hypothetical protein